MTTIELNNIKYTNLNDDYNVHMNLVCFPVVPQTTYTKIEWLN